MDFLGDDIKLNDEGDIDEGDIQINVGSGDFSTASGIECLLQDIMDEFNFPYYDDLDHPERGNMFMKFVNTDSNDKIAAIEFKQEIKHVLNRDPRLKKNSAIIEATLGTEGYFKVVSFETITGNKIENLVVPIPAEVTL